MSPVEALTRRRSTWTEPLRLLTLVAGSVFAVLPFLTARLVGGVDARWYGYMLKGFTDQIGSGHFPFLIGQGPFAWNGGVHPFRSAPAYMLVGGLWKVVTFGRLGPYALQHLTVLTSALAGTLGFYRAATLLLGERRWTAAAFALVYLCIPSWLATVYKADAYMSYMAFGAMPLVLYGNARVLLQPDGRGYVPLAAGLALIWMCHPPIALLTTTTTVFIQAAAIAMQGLASWRQAALGALLFALLSAYYFVSMAELPPRPGGGDPGQQAVVWLLAMAAFVIGLGRTAFFRGRLAWALLGLGGLVVLGTASFPWLVWGLYTTAFCLAAVLAFRALKVADWTGVAPTALFLAAFLAAGAAEATLGKGHPGINGSVVSALASNTGGLGGALAPLPRAMNSSAIFQPGWSVDAALVLALLAVFSRGRPAEQVLGAAPLVLAACYLRFPLVSNFIVGYYPRAFASITGLPLPLRLTPVLTSFALMAGLLWVAARRPATRPSRLLVNGLLLAAVLWSGFQTCSFLRVGYWVTATEAGTAQSLRSENVELDRYAYDLLHIPDYYTNGADDPVLESRLIRADGSVIIGPEELARAAEQAGVRNVQLVGKVIPGSTTWLDVAPTLEVLPGEHLLLRFAFDPALHYNSYMIFFAEHAYREYHLPDSGQPLAFGVGEGRSTVLSLWNSGTTAEHYRMSINREPGNDLNSDGGFFARLAVSKLDPAVLPIRTVSLDPYHAVVTAPTAGFLETFRILLPGYRAYLDGVPVPFKSSKQALLEVAVPAGVHDVVVRFVGSFRLWAAAIVSGAAWAALLGAWVYRRRRAGAW
jgi:hypothetical protein